MSEGNLDVAVGASDKTTVDSKISSKGNARKTRTSEQQLKSEFNSKIESQRTIGFDIHTKEDIEATKISKKRRKPIESSTIIKDMTEITDRSMVTNFINFPFHDSIIVWNSICFDITGRDGIFPVIIVTKASVSVARISIFKICSSHSSS